MKHKLENGKTVNIPDTEIKNNMRILGLTEAEAIQMWLEDNGYEVNEEQNALEKKAKDNRITATIHQAKAEYVKKTQRERVAKEDKPKEDLIKAIAELLEGMEGITEVNITNKAKYVAFKMGDDAYEVNLIRKRAKKE